MTIKKKPVGFHPPTTLCTDAGNYCDTIEKAVAKRNEGRHRSDAAFTIMGNDHTALSAIRDSANKLKPFAQKIADLEAELSRAYNDYDHAAVDLWHLFAEARDAAESQAERHDYSDVAAITAAYNYHAGRAVRHAHGETPATPTSASTK